MTEPFMLDHKGFGGLSAASDVRYVHIEAATNSRKGRIHMVERRRNRPGLSSASRMSANHDVRRPLLADEEQPDDEGYFPSQWTIDQPYPPNPNARLPVFNTIHQ